MKDKMRKCYDNAKQRCGNKNDPKYNYYGGKGIKFLLTMNEIAELWKRDGADKMDRPSLDRIDNAGNYVFSNCRFVEFVENWGRRFEIDTKNLPIHKGALRCPDCLSGYVYTRRLSKTRVCRKCGGTWIF